MFLVKHFGTIAGAKILLASYIGRSETGRNARKSTARGGGSKFGGAAFQAHCSALSGERKGSIKEVYTGDLGNAGLIVRNCMMYNNKCFMYNNNSNGSCAARARGFMAIWAMLALGLASMASPAEAAPFAYVTNGGGTVSVIDTATTPLPWWP
jgi:hypothetical protein